MCSPVIAWILHCLMPGLGHFYYGKVSDAFKVFGLYLALLLTIYSLAHVSIVVVVAFLVLVIFLHIYFLIYFIRNKALSKPPLYSKILRRFIYVTFLICGVLIFEGMQNFRRAVIFKVPGNSMEPAILGGDKVVVDRKAFDHKNPAEGDVVVVVSELGKNQSSLHIRRVKKVENKMILMGADHFPETFEKKERVQIYGKVCYILFPSGRGPLSRLVSSCQDY